MPSKQGTPAANFLATDDIERSSSAASAISDVAPDEFVRAVQALGPDHLVYAMNAAVTAMNASHDDRHYDHHRDGGSTTTATTPRQQRHHHHRTTGATGGARVSQRRQHHGGGLDDLSGDDGDHRSASQQSQQSLLPATPQDPEPGQPVRAELRASPRRHRAEDLRESAVVEGTAGAVVGVPPRVPRGNLYPSTPPYWGSSGAGSPHRHHQNTNSGFAHRRGITTPPVPRPDLESDDEIALAARGANAASAAALRDEQRRMQEQQDWKHGLRRRVAALSEHYRREFAAATGSGGGGDSPAAADAAWANTTTPPPAPTPPQQPHPGLAAAALSPSELVFRSRAVRMSAAECHIIAASPELHAQLDGRARVRSPYGGLLSVTELDHFVPSHAAVATAAPHRHLSLKGAAAIDNALTGASVDMALRAMSGVDSWTRKGMVPDFRSSSSSPPQPPPPPPRTGPVAVALDRASPSEADVLSSPQFSAMLARMVQQRNGAELERVGGGVSSGTSCNTSGVVTAEMPSRRSILLSS